MFMVSKEFDDDLQFEGLQLEESHMLSFRFEFRPEGQFFFIF